jgi:hypothetical protein
MKRNSGYIKTNHAVSVKEDVQAVIRERLESLMTEKSTLSHKEGVVFDGSFVYEDAQRFEKDLNTVIPFIERATSQSLGTRAGRIVPSTVSIKTLPLQAIRGKTSCPNSGLQIFVTSIIGGTVETPADINETSSKILDQWHRAEANLAMRLFQSYSTSEREEGTRASALLLRFPRRFPRGTWMRG